eukprot:m.2184 g.2184  ORF g.2184 m.2184 type:complete len:219 (-) comp3108_c0_seq1:43-699(-)
MTLTAELVDDLVNTTTKIVQAACAAITVTQHEGSHPRIGTVDHISCHDLSSVLQGSTTVGDITKASITLAQQLSSAVAAVGPTTYLYGQANPTNLTLAQLRRELGYFEPTSTGTWQGYSPVQSTLVPAHRGSAEATHGVCCLGAVKWVTNYNVKLFQAEDAARAAILTKGVRRPQLVEALHLPHGTGVEVAMNLLDADQHGPDQALSSLKVGVYVCWS